MLTASQIYSKIDRCCGTNSSTYSLANKAVDVNLAQNEVFAIALQNGGWNIDDFNHTDDPFITINLVENQRNYYFTEDEGGNLILGISRIMVANEDGIFYDLKTMDQQTSGEAMSLVDGQNITGKPAYYDKTGNGIFFDVLPDYSYANGIKIFIDREHTYFTSDDTTKVSGIDPLCHDYLYLKPSYEYCRDKGLQNTNALFRDLIRVEDKIAMRYGTREKDVRNVMKQQITSSR